MQNRHRLLSLTLLFGMVLACRCTRPPLVFSPPELPDAQVGQPYEATIAVGNNETSVFSILINNEEIPIGLTLHYEENASTAVLKGVPERAGEYKFTVYAYCHGTNISGQTGEQRYDLLIKPAMKK